MMLLTATPLPWPAAALLAAGVLVIATVAVRRRRRPDSGTAPPRTATATPTVIISGRTPPTDAGAGHSPASAATAPTMAPVTDPAMAAAGTERAARMQTRLRYYQLAFGCPVHTIAVATAHQTVAASTSAALMDITSQPNYAPRRPLLLPKLLQAVNDSDVSRRELAGIIASDPALAGNLLRLANSSFYRINDQPVESVDRAVAMLGTEGIRSLIAAALMQPVFRIGAGEFAQFPEITWEHTCRCASAAEAHAAIVENSDPFAGQLLGLLLGLAGIVIFRVALDQYTTHAQRADAGTLAALVDTCAAPVAGQIAASWELSERISQALADQAARTAATPLGRSLRFGSFVGTLAALYTHGGCSDADVQAALAAAGYGQPATLRIWERLTQPAY